MMVGSTLHGGPIEVCAILSVGWCILKTLAANQKE